MDFYRLYKCVSYHGKILSNGNAMYVFYRTDHNNQSYSNWDRSSQAEDQNLTRSKSTVLRPTQENIIRKCDLCDDFFFDLPKHNNEKHNIIGQKLVAPLGNGTVFSPLSQNTQNEDLLGIEKIRTGPKTPDGIKLFLYC